MPQRVKKERDDGKGVLWGEWREMMICSPSKTLRLLSRIRKSILGWVLIFGFVFELGCVNEPVFRAHPDLTDKGGNMPEGPSVMAAPNRCHITAKIIQIRPSAEYPDKKELEIEILATEPLEGPNFAKAGQKSHAFTFEDSDALMVGNVVTAKAEFIGGRGQGVFQLTQLVTSKASP
jgi:hypothetical protein